MDGYQDVTFYVQVEPDVFVPSSGQFRVRSAKARTVTQKRPTAPLGGAVVVKLTLRISNKAFLPLEPEATVTIPDSLAELVPVEVIAEDAHG